MTTRTALTATLALALLPTAACLTGGDDLEDQADEIASQLELDNGGLDMEDEAPMFGDSELFDSADVTDATVYTDAMGSDAEVVAMADAPDAAIYDAVVLWGQMPAPDFDTDLATDWSGTLSVNRGALVVDRTIRFDGADRIDGRDDRRTVRFTSRTRPHHDGLHVRVIDPDPASDEPLTLRYALDDGRAYDLRLDNLVDGFESRVVDARGNRVTAGAIRDRFDPCAHGRLAGRWHQVTRHRGVFVGGVTNARGETIGHIRGIYGQRRNGDQVFFGKYINRSGRFMGIFRGTYGEGHFQGAWANRAGELGALGGEYRETVPGPRIGGHFLGRWTELTCDMPLPRPRPSGN